MHKDDIAEMLDTIGVRSIDELFRDVPAEVRVDLDLPGPMDEADLSRHLDDLSSLNVPLGQSLSFLGGGVYDHHIPPAVFEIASRAELFTSYTPYQAEMSQGMLQAIFEFQSLGARLLDMDVVNASMYDGATALGEAVRMASRISKADVVHVPRAIAPWKREILRNYTDTAGISIVDVPYDSVTGELDASSIDGSMDILYVESPNYLGVVEKAVEELRERCGLLIMGVNPISMGILRPPGTFGADIAVAEGQPLGVPPGFGGPLLGMLASKKKYVRQMPGRLIAMTEDSRGERAFCMTLQTREQHIRRHRATSNICTNHGLCAVMSAVFMALKGPELGAIAERCASNRDKLEMGLEGIGIRKRFSGSHFNEFVVGLPAPFEDIQGEMLTRGILPGIHMDGIGLEDHLMVATTEKHTEDDINRFIKAMEEVVD